MSGLQAVGDATERYGDRLRSAWDHDWVKLLVALAVMYAGYLLVGSVLGYSLRGQLNSLSRLTFLVAIYALLALALNLHWGYTGLFNIGIAGFVAVGLYTMAMVSKPAVTGQGAAQISGLGLPLPVGILAGVLVAALLGLVVALPALRMRADYLAITTIAMAEIVRFFYLSSQFQSVTVRPVTIALGPVEFTLFSRLLGDGVPLGTGGGRGLILNYPDPLAPLFNFTVPFTDFTPYAALVAALDPYFAESIRPIVDGLTYAAILLVVFVTAYYWLLARVGRSPFGRVLKAIREDEQVANSLGKDTARFKIKAFMLGCALMGLAGILWQMRQGAVTPNSFRPKFTFYVWVALVIGGAGSNTGSVLGAALFAAVLFEGPRYVKNVVTELVSLPDAPPTLAAALAPLFDPVLAFGGVANAVPILAVLGVLGGVAYGTDRVAARRDGRAAAGLGAVVTVAVLLVDGLVAAGVGSPLVATALLAVGGVLAYGAGVGIERRMGLPVRPARRGGALAAVLVVAAVAAALGGFALAVVLLAVGAAGTYLVERFLVDHEGIEAADVAVGAGGTLAVLAVVGVLVAAGGDPVPFFAYAFGSINALQLVFMGCVLVVLIRFRPEGLLGHRKEEAASVPLGRRDRAPAGAPVGGEVAADGGAAASDDGATSGGGEQP